MILQNKIDFAVVFRVKRANPNGDPLNGNRPRTDYENYGEVTDVCIKRKIRDRLQEEKHGVFVQSQDRADDGHPSLRARADAILGSDLTAEELAKKACSTWFDVRAFGQLFAFKGKGKGKGKKTGKAKAAEATVAGDAMQDAVGGGDTGVSIGIRGPVTIQSAFSLKPVDVASVQITKSVSSEGDGTKRGSDTMGMKHRVEDGIYVFYGSMNPQLAERTGFSSEDAEMIKKILPRIFQNDESSARPAGSMQVLKVVWWRHNCKPGQYSSARVHQSIKPEVDPSEPGKVDIRVVEDLPGLKPELIDGF